MQLNTSRHIVRLTAAIGVEGRILRPGTLVECSALESADLIGRRQAVAATEPEVEQAAEIIVAPVRTAEQVFA